MKRMLLMMTAVILCLISVSCGAANNGDPTAAGSPSQTAVRKITADEAYGRITSGEPCGDTGCENSRGV